MFPLVAIKSLAMYIDPKNLVYLGKKAEGITPIVKFTRLISDLPQQSETSVEWQVTGFKDQFGRSFLDVIVKAAPVLCCQRCMGMFSYPVETNSRLMLVYSEEELHQPESENESPDDWAEPILAVSSLDVLELIEDELILALPYVPKHESCTTDALEKSRASNGSNDVEPSPFNILSQLKKN